MQNPLSIVTVIPAFRPEARRFAAVLAALATQCVKIIVVDNGGARNLADVISQNLGIPVEVLGCGDNIGVAAAQNLGIRRGLDLGAEGVLFMDQDSVAHPDMVRHLSTALVDLQRKGGLVAACGPRYHEPGCRSLSGFIRAERFRLRACLPPDGEASVPCDFLISSGMLVPAETLRVVGEMEEGLFIDHVDTEWCFRAKRDGYGCHGVEAARMEHELGRSRKKIWLGRWRQIPNHSPERMYFLVRNSIWLLRRNYISLACKLYLLTRFLGLSILSIMIDGNRSQRVFHLTMGFRDAFRKSTAGTIPSHV